MKIKSTIYSVLLAGLLLPILLNCKKEAIKTAPTVSISAATNVTAISASAGGDIPADGGAAITAKGVCWSISQNPTTSDSKTSNGSGTGSFTGSITGLTPGTTYNLRAYAINSVGTGYSSQTTFTTLALAPVLTTIDLSAITATTATSGGNISNDGGSSVTARGVCWSKSQNPTIADTKTTDGTGSGSFTSAITGLTPGTTYYFRAYATNGIGTAYGNQVTAITTATLSTLTTTAVSAIASSSATSGGNITSDGGAPITARGVCWSTSANPTITNSKTTDGTGTGSFTSAIAGLTPGATYYVKAYATNSIGTAYGNELTLTAAAISPVLTTGNISNITATTATGGGNITTDGGSPVTARGVCWSTSSNPTILNSKTTDGAGTGSFMSSITGLTQGTTYHIRAYATNSIGTGYGSEISFTTPQISGSTITDIDGNVYSTVTIGTQVWMASNLKTTKYNDGTNIPNVTDNATWSMLATPGYCWYNNDAATNKILYGALYNWFTVSTGKLCPAGWRVPTDAEWLTLTTFLGGEIVAGGKLKEIGISHWTNPNTGASNLFGFTALPCSGRMPDGPFGNPGYNGSWWSSAEYSTEGAWMRVVDYLSSNLGSYAIDKRAGYSVRCISGELTLPTLPTLSTTSISNIASSSAISGGTINSDGGTPVVARGVCWSTTSNPTVANSKTSDGTGFGSFTSNLTGLTAGTTYYYRAYATNSAGTGYGNEVSFKTDSNNNSIIFNPDLTYGTVTDIDGNVYKTITIGTQTWMAENLRVTRYRDGTLIRYVPDSNDWRLLLVPGYCYYDNDFANKNIYGALYNWDAVSFGSLSPTGWHIPTDAEWKKLTDYLGGEIVAGGKLKETGTTHWLSPNTGATNESGFTGLPSRQRGYTGDFTTIGGGFWWGGNGYYNYCFRSLGFNIASMLGETYINPGTGFSVRCIKD